MYVVNASASMCIVYLKWSIFWSKYSTRSTKQKSDMLEITRRNVHHKCIKCTCECTTRKKNSHAWIGVWLWWRANANKKTKTLCKPNGSKSNSNNNNNHNKNNYASKTGLITHRTCRYDSPSAIDDFKSSKFLVTSPSIRLACSCTPLNLEITRCNSFSTASQASIVLCCVLFSSLSMMTFCFLFSFIAVNVMLDFFFFFFLE